MATQITACQNSIAPPTAKTLASAALYSAVPETLKALPNWVCWRSEIRKGKLTKIPYDANQNGNHVCASTNNAATWASFARAVEAADPLNGSEYNGIGFVFTDMFQGADLDGVVRTVDDVAGIDPFARAIAKIANTYCEYSPSGTGLHLIWQSPVPLPSGNRKGNKQLGGELYDKNSPRYFTVTGHEVPEVSTGVLATIEDPNTIRLLHFLVLSVHDPKIANLWLGKWQETTDSKGKPFPSQSEADLALCNALVRVGFDSFEKVDVAFQQSGLMRPEWSHKKKYTIAKALGKQSASEVSDPVEEYEATSATVLEYPQMGNDLLSQYARLLTQGTAIPFGHVRECLKNVLAFCLSDATHYPNHEKLYLRGWHFNIGEPETCKTEALIRVMTRWTNVLNDFGIYIDKLSSYGSLQYLTKGFEDHERMFLYVTEGNTLANANEHVAAIFGGLSDLYDQPVISAGSYRNKSAKCVHAKGSCIVCFTPDDFIKAMQGKGVIGGGVLPRWTMSCAEKIHVGGDWPSPPEAALRSLQQQMRDRVNGVDVVETAQAQAIRIALTKEMERPEAGRHGKRLIEHYKRECLLAAVFASSGTAGESVGIITKEIAEWAAIWTRYQLHLRIAYWPIDAGNDVERMCTAMRMLLKRAHPKGVALKNLKDAAHVYREGSGGVEAFGRAYRAMMANEDMRKIGQNRNGKDLFGLVSD